MTTTSVIILGTYDVHLEITDFKCYDAFARIAGVVPNFCFEQLHFSILGLDFVYCIY